MTTYRREGGMTAAEMRETLHTAAEMLAACRRMLATTAKAVAQYTVANALHRAAESAAKALARRAGGAAMRMAQCENAMKWMRDALADDAEGDTPEHSTLTKGKEVTA
ncbi:MAG TPA: hypothetical protein DC009_07200 [Porphyromonadaceae bacterium]|nr:hypothetical protein [Porphyromonadaceae bacterium]